ncbi:hypothetical protein BJ165DRAFT_1534912 [Panaeolus papilionaceus]|nr:hypothetical protein BJ165DRAFT_1534912 [Panaeolus papilionaceus]
MAILLRSHSRQQQISSQSQPRSNTNSAPPLTQTLAPRTVFLLGHGPLLSISNPERAAASLRTMLDGDEGGNQNQPTSTGPNYVIVRVPLKETATSDILVPSNISHTEFFRHVCDVMAVHSGTTKLGWKTTKDPKRALARELLTPEQLETAMKTLNPNVPIYEAELLLLQDTLHCNYHSKPDEWCYVKPGTNNVDDHIILGVEELRLWARNMNLCRCPRMPAKPPTILLKRKYVEDDSDSDGVADHKEDLLMSSHVRSLHRRFPELMFPQYLGQLQARGLFYARSALNFGPDYYLELGMLEGAVGIFLDETGRVLRKMRRQGIRKRLRSQYGYSSDSMDDASVSDHSEPDAVSVPDDMSMEI